MTRQFLNSPSDCQWLRDTVLKKTISRVPRFHSFILDGNEDYPNLVILYRDVNPRFDSRPLATLIAGVDYYVS